MTGVIYARYSSKNQKEESIEGQIRENMKYAERNDIKIIDTYIDRAYTGKNDDRPEFQRMIKESAVREYDVVLVWMFDRFARNRTDSAIYKSILKRNGKRVISAKESISKGPSGILLESVIEGMAEYYSEELKEKVNRGLTENALKCKYNGGASIPLGYVIDADQHYQIDSTTAPIVLEIFTRYANGETISDLISDLNTRGLKTSRGVPFNKNSFHNMLKNTNYIGVYHYRDITIPDGVPAIVPKDIFDKAASRLKSNKRFAAKNKAKERYILTTKLFCGECECMLTADSVNKKNGTVYRYYKCVSARRHKCDLKPIRKEPLEDFVVNKTVEKLSDKKILDKIIKAIMSVLDEENVVIPALEKQLRNVKRSKENVMKAIMEGIVTRTTKAKLEELEQEEDRLKDEIQMEKLNTPTITEEQIRFTINKFINRDMRIEKNREDLIDNLVGSILIYKDGRVIITYNFGIDPVTSTLDEIIAAANCGSDTDCIASPKKSATEVADFFIQAAGTEAWYVINALARCMLSRRQPCM